MLKYTSGKLCWYKVPQSKVSSMSGGNMSGCWICQHQQAPTLIK